MCSFIVQLMSQYGLSGMSDTTINRAHREFVRIIQCILKNDSFARDCFWSVCWKSDRYCSQSPFAQIILVDTYMNFLLKALFFVLLIGKGNALIRRRQIVNGKNVNSAPSIYYKESGGRNSPLE